MYFESDSNSIELMFYFQTIIFKLVFLLNAKDISEFLYRKRKFLILKHSAWKILIPALSSSKYPLRRILLDDSQLKKNSKCSCSDFKPAGYCIHIVGLLINFKRISIPIALQAPGKFINFLKFT